MLCRPKKYGLVYRYHNGFGSSPLCNGILRNHCGSTVSRWKHPWTPRGSGRQGHTMDTAIRQAGFERW